MKALLQRLDLRCRVSEHRRVLRTTQSAEMSKRTRPDKTGARPAKDRHHLLTQPIELRAKPPPLLDARLRRAQSTAQIGHLCHASCV